MLNQQPQIEPRGFAAVQAAVNTAVREAAPGWAGDDLRYGQALFLALGEVRPELADVVAGKAFDPYYENRNVPAFWDALRMMTETEA